MRKCIIACALMLTSCAALDTVVDVLGPTGEKTGETTVGSILADSGVGDTAGAIVTGITGNPLLGTAAAAAIAGALLGVNRRRKKAKTNA